MTAKGQRAELYAVVCIANAGVPAIVWQSGEFSATVTDVGPGITTLTLNAANGVADAEAAYSIGIRGAVTRITASVIGIAGGPSVDATRDKQVRTSTGAGVATDTGFILAIYRRLFI